MQSEHRVCSLISKMCIVQIDKYISLGVKQVCDSQRLVDSPFVKIGINIFLRVRPKGRQHTVCNWYRFFFPSAWKLFSISTIVTVSDAHFSLRFAAAELLALSWANGIGGNSSDSLKNCCNSPMFFGRHLIGL